MNINQYLNYLLKVKCFSCQNKVKANYFKGYHCSCNSLIMSTYTDILDNITNITYTLVLPNYRLILGLKPNFDKNNNLKINCFIEKYHPVIHCITLNNIPINLLNNSLTLNQAVQYCDSLFNYI